MASNQAVAPASAPLAMLTRLSPIVYYHEPSTAEQPDTKTTADTTNPPKLILVFAWLSAQDAHVAKYITQHRALYPTARILLITCPFSQMFTSSLTALQPAVDALAALVDTLPATDSPQILIHSFSNGGGYNVLRFSRLWQSSTNGPLPPHVLVLDSAPDRLNIGRSLNALTAAIPRWLQLPAKAVLAFTIIPLTKVFGLPNVPDLASGGLLAKMVMAREARRTYVYSKEDDMVSYVDVETHSREAEKRAGTVGSGTVVRRELFVGSGHVAHARLDGDRYWRIVRETWEGSS